MPVSSSTEHWIKPDALTINLNHFGDPDYLQVSVLAGAVVMAFKQDVIGYNAAHNYRTWPLEAANTYLETTSAYNVYARLTRSEVNARALVIYDPILRDIEGREITYEKNEETGAEKEILGEPNENFYFIFLGQLSSSISKDGRSVLREWTSEYRSGSLETNEQQNDWMAILNKMFRPHYDDPLDPDTLTWIEAKAHIGIAGGLTSFIDNGTLKLPSIYDGLPIDNQTLYWEEIQEEVGTDEEGNPIYQTTRVLKSKGGGSGTGGSIEHALTWSGFSTGSYDGKSAQNIEIPNNTNQLTNGAGFITSSALSGYATETWVTNKGYITSSALSGYATETWVTNKGYITSSALNGYATETWVGENFLPITGGQLQGDLRLRAGSEYYGRTLYFGDGSYVYIKEDVDDHMLIFGNKGVDIEMGTSYYLEVTGKGIKLNGGILTYNESDGYFELDGNLLVTGGITAFADSGAGNQWILDATALSGVTSTSQYKVYSARVTKLLKDEVYEIVDKIAAIKSSFSGLSSSSSASAIGSALKTLASKL